MSQSKLHNYMDGMFHDQFEAILENDCMCHVSGPSWDEMACNTSLLGDVVSKQHADWDLALRYEFRVSNYLWIHVSIWLGEREHTQQTFL